MGGTARTLAAEHGCHVTGLDLTQAFCEAAAVISDWVGLGERVAFRQGDATNMPFADRQFDATITIHVAMNIAAKVKLYEEARRFLFGAEFAEMTGNQLRGLRERRIRTVSYICEA